MEETRPGGQGSVACAKCGAVVAKRDSKRWRIYSRGSVECYDNGDIAGTCKQCGAFFSTRSLTEDARSSTIAA